MSSNLWLPRKYRQQRKPIRIVFYHSRKLDRVEVGAPEQFPVPPPMVALGYEKIVCTTAKEVEKWSKKKSDQDRRDAEMDDYQRELIEGPIRDAVRKDLIDRMLTSRNQLNRDFCKFALDKLDERERNGRVVRESHMHIEAFEEGK